MDIQCFRHSAFNLFFIILIQFKFNLNAQSIENKNDYIQEWVFQLDGDLNYAKEFAKLNNLKFIRQVSICFGQ